MTREPLARLGRHPIHPMFVVFPIGLWIFGLIMYIITLAGGGPNWDIIAWYCIGGGIIGAALAAVFGFVDLLGLPASPARNIAIWHMCFNVVSLGLFVAAFALRWNAEIWMPLYLIIIGTVTLAVGGWLGGSLVYVHGVGISNEGIAEHQSRAAASGYRPEAGMGPSVVPG